MAISKLLHMKDCGGSFHGKHLKASIEYVMNVEKTQGGRLVGAVNCKPDTAFREMKATKQKFGKTDRRQGYHLILSFKENEADPDIAFEVTKRFVEEYLGKEYEAVYVVHDNTDHVHSHIIFNSVSYLTGKKYRYEKGDWARYIQPLTNRLCREFGLSVLELEEGSDRKERRMENKERYREWNEYRDGKFVWSDMIRRDVDACILQADDFEGFLELLADKGYEIRQNRYLAIRPPGMKPFRRCHTLGEDYSEERIRERILSEDISHYRAKDEEIQPRIVRCRVKRYRRAALSGLQKKYYAKLYRTGQLKKKPYSAAWKYKDDIRDMQRLQREYLFLAGHDIRDAAGLVAVISALTEKKKEASAEKSRAFRERGRFKGLFELLAESGEFQAAENAFRQGDDYFAAEHEKWEEAVRGMKEMGYTPAEAEALRDFYRGRIAQAKAKEAAVSSELRTAEQILRSLGTEAGESAKQMEKTEEHELGKRLPGRQPFERR